MSYRPKLLFLACYFSAKEKKMAKEHLKGATDKTSAATKEGIGKAPGDKSMEAKGKIDKAKGEARDALGDAKDSIKKGRDDKRH